MNILDRILPNRRSKKHYLISNGQLPVYSDNGSSIYMYDIVQWCIGYVATEIGKLQPKHVRIDDENKQEIVNGSINRLLSVAPNPLMITKDFLEKCIWQLYLNYNCFIYPDYDLRVNNQGAIYKEYTAFWPLNPQMVEFSTDSFGKMYMDMTFRNGVTYYGLPYEDFIHLRMKYSVNDILGGGDNGMPDNAPLLRTLKIGDEVTTMLPAALRASMGANLNLKIKTMMDYDKKEKARENFISDLRQGDGGVLVTDIGDEIVPININPKVIDKETMAFLQQKVFNWFGMSPAVISGDFTDEQYQAVYEKSFEPIIVGATQAFSKTLFTPSQLSRGNRVIFYPQQLLFSNTKNKIAVAEILGNRGALTDNQLLAIFGYPPYEGGDIRQKSLNFININIADEYQFMMANRKRRAQDGTAQDTD